MSGEIPPQPAPPPGPPPAPPPGGTGFDVAAIQAQVAQETEVQANIAQALLIVSEDRLRLRLYQFEKAVIATKAWEGPTGFALGILANLYQLKSAGPEFTLMGLSRDLWIGVNGCALFFSGVLVAIRVIQAFRANRKANTVDAVVASLRPSPRTQAVGPAPPP